LGRGLVLRRTGLAWVSVGVMRRMRGEVFGGQVAGSEARAESGAPPTAGAVTVAVSAASAAQLRERHGDPLDDGVESFFVGGLTLRIHVCHPTYSCNMTCK